MSSPSLPPLREDGLPTLPTGEPVLHRWFVIVLLVLAPVAVAVTAWGLLSSTGGGSISAAERRPPGTAEVTTERGGAQLAVTQDAEPGPGCAQGIRVVGDSGSRAAASRAMEVACELIATGDFPVAREGLVDWVATDGLLRIATFELSGVESSSRVDDDGRIIVELNAKFQFDDAMTGTPALLHQLHLIADPGWPGAPISADTELAAAAAQREACDRLRFPEAEPRGCLDVRELLDDPDPRQQLLDAGYRPGDGDVAGSG